MATDNELTLVERILQLLQQLGIERAHFAASVLGDLREIPKTRADLIASLMLVLPQGFDPDAHQWGKSDRRNRS
jgi:hypothetical protein